MREQLNFNMCEHMRMKVRVQGRAKLDENMIVKLGGRHCTEVAFPLLT